MDKTNPDHYTKVFSFECIDIAEHLGFCFGNAFKYTFRAGEKEDINLDLDKAMWYIRRGLSSRPNWFVRTYRRWKARKFAKTLEDACELDICLRDEVKMSMLSYVVRLWWYRDEDYNRWINAWIADAKFLKQEYGD